MNQTQIKIAAGLEQAFAAQGFAEPNIERLRDAAGVSLRTLYKYMPSRDDMMLAALEHRHGRYMAMLLEDLPDEGALDAALDRVADWMATEASHGCLFHSAVAASPGNAALRALLQRHKAEVSRELAARLGLPEREAEITVIVEGLTQSWPLLGDAATVAAKRLAGSLAADLA